MRKKIVLIFIGVIGAMGFMEVGLRLFYPQETAISLISIYSFPCYQPKSYHWSGLKKNADCILKSLLSAFPDTQVHTNSMGLRNPEIEKEKPKDSIRILFLGDSYTFGWGVSPNEAYPRVVEIMLRKKFPEKKIEVINAGIPAVGIGYQYLFLKNEGLILKPDIVIIGFHPFSDIMENAQHSVWEDLDIQGLPTKIDSKSTYIDPTTSELFPKKIPLKLKIPILRNSHLFALVMDTLWPSNIIQEKYFNGLKLCFHQPECQELTTPIEKAKKLFTGIDTITDTNNIKLMVVIKPAEYQVYDSDPYVRLKYGISTPLSPWQLSYPHKVFTSFFDERKIEYIDMLPIFVAQNTSELYFKKDDHWNPLGHRIAAEEISKRLERYIGGVDLSN